MSQLPTPAEITAARLAAGDTPTQAAAKVRTTYRTWHKWESGERSMAAATWDLYRIRSSLIPATWPLQG